MQLLDVQQTLGGASVFSPSVSFSQPPCFTSPFSRAVTQRFSIFRDVETACTVAAVAEHKSNIPALGEAVHHRVRSRKSILACAVHGCRLHVGCMENHNHFGLSTPASLMLPARLSSQV